MIGQRLTKKMYENLLHENKELKERNRLLEEQSESVTKLSQQYLAKIKESEYAINLLEKEISEVHFLKQEYKRMVEYFKLNQADYEKQMHSLLSSMRKGVR